MRTLHIYYDPSLCKQLKARFRILKIRLNASLDWINASIKYIVTNKFDHMHLKTKGT